MDDYSYLFESEEELNYSEEDNVILLFQALNDEKFLEKIDKTTYSYYNFLLFILPFKNYITKVFKYNSLIYYNYIDLFQTQSNLIEFQINKRIDFLKQDNYKKIERLWDTIIPIIDMEESIENMFNDKELINDINLNENEYFHFLVNQIWLNSKNVDLTPFSQSYFIDINLLAKKILLYYYYQKYYICNLKNLLNNEKENNEFLKLLVKFRNIYISDKPTNIFFKKEVNLTESEKQEQDKYQKLYIQMNDKEQNMLKFINFLVENNYININIIQWFYVLFSKYIPEELNQHFLILLLKLDNGTLNFIFLVLQELDIDFFKLDIKDYEEFIKTVEANYDKIYNIQTSNYFEEIDFKQIINNMFFLTKLKDMSNNPELTYKFLSLDIEKLSLDQFFFICDNSPLTVSNESILYKQDNRSKKYNSLMKKHSLKKLINAYNSVTITQNLNKCFLLTNYNIILIYDFDTQFMLYENIKKIYEENPLNNQHGHKLRNQQFVPMMNLYLDIIYISYPSYKLKNTDQQILFFKSLPDINNNITENHFHVISFDLNILLYRLLEILGQYSITPLKDKNLKNTLENNNTQLQNLTEIFQSIYQKQNIQYGYSTIK